MNSKVGWWRQWLEEPQRSRLHTSLFQMHFWFGAVAGMYVMLMSITGSIIVFRNRWSGLKGVEWLVNLHTNLLAGSSGRLANGVGAASLTLLCLTGAIIWWPGVKHWRRSLQVNWRANVPRVYWDLHSAVGLWCFPFILVWGISGLYFAFPQTFSLLFVIDPGDRVTDRWLFWLPELHFGRFTLFTEVVWALLGLVPGFLHSQAHLFAVEEFSLGSLRIHTANSIIAGGLPDSKHMGMPVQPEPLFFRIHDVRSDGPRTSDAYAKQVMKDASCRISPKRSAQSASSLPVSRLAKQ